LFELADLDDKAGAGVEKFDDARVELVDFAAQVLELFRRGWLGHDVGFIGVAGRTQTGMGNRLIGGAAIFSGASVAVSSPHGGARVNMTRQSELSLPRYPGEAGFDTRITHAEKSPQCPENVTTAERSDPDAVHANDPPGVEEE
jgi:hypothetical protein